MLEGSGDIPGESGPASGAEVASGGTVSDEPASESTERRTDRRRGAGGAGGSRGGRRWRGKKHSWVWWLANLMILAGVLCIPGYFLGTCAVTAVKQNELRQQLVTESPQVTIVPSSIGEADFTPVDIKSDNTVQANASEAEKFAAEQAAKAAKEEHDRQLAAFKAAADAFAAEVGGEIGQPIGRIIIPSIKVDVVMVEGTSKGDLKEGPGHWEEKPFPGQNGNFVVSGHRTTYGGPFFKLDKVKVGDEIQIILPYVIARYTVTKTMIVSPNQVDTVRSVGREQVSLAACHPIYSAKQRIVVQGDLTSFKLIDQGAQGTPQSTETPAS